MSLLNDALRKKKAESRTPPADPGRVLRPQPDRRLSTNRRRWVSAAAVGIVLAGALLLFWNSRTAGEPETVPAATPFVIDVEDAISEAPAAADAPAPTTSPAADRLLPTDAEPPSATPAETGAEPARPAAAEPASIPLVHKDATAPFSAKAMRKPSSDGRLAGLANAAPPKEVLAGREAGPAASVQRPAVARLYEKARLYHRQERFEHAIGLYREILKIDPGHFDTRFNLVSAYLQTEAFEKAHPVAADLYRQRPDNPAVILNLAIARIGCGDAALGLTLLDQAEQRSDAPLFEIYLHQGIAYRHLDQGEAAVASYHKAERIQPGDPRLLFNLAVALDQQQSYEEAIRYYLKYVQAAKNETPADRRRIEQRVRDLRAALSANETGEEQPQ